MPRRLFTVWVQKDVGRFEVVHRHYSDHSEAEREAFRLENRGYPRAYVRDTITFDDLYKTSSGSECINVLRDRKHLGRLLQDGFNASWRFIVDRKDGPLEIPLGETLCAAAKTTAVEMLCYADNDRWFRAYGGTAE